MTQGHNGWPYADPSSRLYMPRAGLPAGASFANIQRVVPPPPVETFTWVNQSTATASNVSNGIYLSGPGTSAPDLHLLVQAVAAPWTIKATYISDLSTASNVATGVAYRESGTGEIVYIGVFSTTIISEKFDSATVGNSSYSLTNTPLAAAAAAGTVSFKMQDDGTNRVTSWSRDGINFRVLHTVSRTDFLTANQAGFFIRTDAGFAALTLISWEYITGVV